MLWHKIKINKSSFKSVASDFKSNVEKYFRILFLWLGFKVFEKNTANSSVDEIHIEYLYAVPFVFNVIPSNLAETKA